MRTISAIGGVAGGASIALQGVWAVRRAGVALPASSLVAASAVTVGLAILAAILTASSAWRGPTVESLPRDDIAVCEPPEAEKIRAAAQLRGTMGGAGHVHPLRLAFPFAAWLSVAAAALEGRDVLDAAPWLALLAASVAGMLLFPAKAFLYREATGGCVVLHPARAREELSRSSAARATGQGGRGTP